MTINDTPMSAAIAAHRVPAPANVSHHKHGLHAEREHHVLSNDAQVADSRRTALHRRSSWLHLV